MKTLEGWHKSEARTLEDYLIVGDEVDKDMVGYFLDILPPLTNRQDMLQVGEPYSIAKDENGQYHSTWTTFYFKEGKWYYAGNCFQGEIIDRKSEEPWEE